jgi:hypothetical protein
MKRKLVLIFEDNQLLSVSLTERGRRSRLQPIASDAAAIKEVKATVVSALDTLSKAEPKPVIVDTTVVTTTAKEVPASLTPAAASKVEPHQEMLDRQHQEMLDRQVAMFNLKYATQNTNMPLVTVLDGGFGVNVKTESSTEPSGESLSSIATELRPKSVCARPKVVESLFTPKVDIKINED